MARSILSDPDLRKMGRRWKCAILLLWRREDAGSQNRHGQTALWSSNDPKYRAGPALHICWTKEWAVRPKPRTSTQHAQTTYVSITNKLNVFQHFVHGQLERCKTPRRRKLRHAWERTGPFSSERILLLLVEDLRVLDR